METITRDVSNMEEMRARFAHIKGWGVDADPENEPTYPMKHYNGADHLRLNYERPPLQPVDREVLHSNERPNVTAVFGTSVPPSGISGAIRRYAFKYSEGSWNHWLPLILADRINVVEGLVDDLKRGYIPNIFAEKGWKAELKYNPKGLAIKVGTLVAAGAAIWWMLGSSSKKKRLSCP
jgi:hypothetical protein